MKDFDTIITLVNRAKRKTELHRQEIQKHPYWPSGHKSKAERAILLAREMLLEVSKRLDEPREGE